ncbi:MAG: MopE-related protein [Crocinitomicaceae bacterium]
MKQTLLLLGLSLSTFAYSQCSPTDCSALLPAYGGICDSVLDTAIVNQAYSDFESFVITDNCFDAGLIDPGSAGTNIKITNVDNFTFTGMPAGITAQTNQTSYSPPASSYTTGCASYDGIPTEIGVFNNSIDFLADVVLCGFLPIAQNDNPANYILWLVVLPDPTFTGLSSTYCENDGAVTLTVTGTPGGVFSGPGVTGNTFDPAAAGPGTHTIQYLVSAQEGAAVAPATDSMEVIVTVNSNATWYEDLDGDNFGNSSVSQVSCDQPAGYVLVDGDCDDADVSIYPGAPDICDNIDNDCDGSVDEDATFVDYYPDLDGDGYGDESATPVNACQAPQDYVTDNTDCDDTNGQIFPGALEIPGNGIDEDCDGTDNVIDQDNDGFDNTVDCNDNDNTVYPGAPELCDGLDNDCNGLTDDGLTFTNYYTDNDNDGFGTGTALSLCSNPGAGYATIAGDCNDNDDTIFPGATELCDGLDNDCNGQTDDGLTFTNYYVDSDNDGYGTGAAVSFCSNPGAGYSTADGDCNDNDNTINPGATEICDGIDNNCNGQTDEGLTTNYYIDNDGDGVGVGNPIPFCSNPGAGYATVDGDCNDNDGTIYPGAPEICDALDNNCDGVTDEGLTYTDYWLDNDGDGFGAGPVVSSCISPGANYVTQDGDCDNNDDTIYPGAVDIADNQIDENCDGVDGYLLIQDTELHNVTIHPNPASNMVTILGENIEKVMLIDLTGSIVLETKNVQIDINALHKGVYIVRVYSKSDYINLRLLKQ